LKFANSKKKKRKNRKFFSEVLLDFGEPPVLYDSVLTKGTTKQLEKFYFNKGYFDAEVKDSTYKKNKKARVFYLVSSKEPYRIDTITYAIEDELLAYYVFLDTASSLIKKGNIFDTDVLQKERERVGRDLLNNGYYKFAKEYMYYTVDSSRKTHTINITIGVKNYSVPHKNIKDSLLEIPHPRYYINQTIINTNYTSQLNDNSAPDTIQYLDFVFLYNKKLEYKPRNILTAVYVHKGDLYQISNVEATYKRLSELKAFKLVTISFKEVRPGYLDCFISLSPINKQSFTLEGEYTTTSGNNGISGSFTYQNKNAFKSFEIFEIKLRGGINNQKLINENAADKNQNLIKFNTIELGPEANMDIPRFLLPFRVNASKNSEPKTRFTSALNYQVRSDYERYASNIAFGYNWKETAQKKHTINPLEISYVKIDKKESFETFLKNTNDFLILTSYTDHFTISSRYGFNYNSQDLKKQSKKYNLFRFGLESSGNTLRLLNKLANSPKDTSGSYRLFNVIYSQYIRTDADFRHFKILSPQRSIVFRAYAGLGYALENLNVLPFEKSFFAGGTNGIRAWRARSLGPGSFQSAAQSAYDQIGDIQLETNIEYRFKVYGFLNAAIFADAGNVWLKSPNSKREGGDFKLDTFYKEIAIGVGTGLRADFTFFIFRLDVGAKVRDPLFGEKGRWVARNMFDKSWKAKYASTYGSKYDFFNINIGLGYPF
ncbi:MAG: BamA/TamA family outer membrane protein, partial [Bacteroidetes bacterium]|nr:BamA/TamA family outer membrane protein [Bacteroidota bacterium]